MALGRIAGNRLPCAVLVPHRPGPYLLTVLPQTPEGKLMLLPRVDSAWPCTPDDNEPAERPSTPAPNVAPVCRPLTPITGEVP